MHAKTEPIAPLPSGEHPWAAKLRLWRRSLAVARLATALAVTIWLFQPERSMAWAILTQANFDSPVTRALTFSAALASIYGLCLFPLSFLRDFVVEKKAGLSTQSLGGWLVDRLKGLLLVAVLGSIVVSGLTACLLWGRASWWLLASLGSALFGIVLARLAPQLLIPVFFKMKPLERQALAHRFQQLAENTGTPVLGIFEIDLSRRTRAANAAVVGFGASRRALVADTLLENFNEDEIEFVLAHELAHHRYHDLWTGIAASALLTTASLFFAHLVISHSTEPAGRMFQPMGNGFNPVVIFWIAVLTSIAGLVLSPLSLALSRFVEARADAFAAATTHKPAQGASAFRKLGFQNLAVFQPPLWEELLLHSHPSIARRIARLS